MVMAPALPCAGERTQWVKAYILRLSVTDIVVVAAAVFLAQYVRFGQSPLSESNYGYRLTGYSVIFALLWLSSLAIFHTRSRRVIGGGVDEYRFVISASFWTFGAIAIISLLFKLDLARGYLAVALPVGTLALLAGRYLWRRNLGLQRAAGQCQTAVVAIGDRRAVTELAHEVTKASHYGFKVVGVGIPNYGEPCGENILVNGESIPILGDEVHAIAAVETIGADTVAITDTEHFGVHGIRSLLWQLEPMDIDLVVSPGVMDVAGQRLVMRPVAGYPLIHVEKPQYRGAKRFAKRAFDVCFALAALLMAAPILLVAAIAIKLDSRGPVFYVAERIGLDGQPFKMLKLRTMVVDADSQLGALREFNECVGSVLFKMRKDPRITTVGRFLRKYSLDELPQFIHVLKKEMSIVGPRPPLRCEVETYNGEAARRLLVRPGITGLWQVSGRSNLSWDEAVRLDLSYVENWSMISDLVIILKTIKAVLLRQGAY